MNIYVYQRNEPDFSSTSKELMFIAIQNELDGAVYKYRPVTRLR